MHFSTVDVFSTHPFGGNPASILLVDENDTSFFEDTALLLNIAMELATAKTVFVRPFKCEKTHTFYFSIRCFTPLQEVVSCGHGIMGAAHVLWRDFITDDDVPLFFETRSGVVKTFKKEGLVFVQLLKRIVKQIAMPEEVLEILGCDEPPIFVGLSRDTYFVEMRSPLEVFNIKPKMVCASFLGNKNIIITANNDRVCFDQQNIIFGQYADFDYVSRFFEPRVGIVEGEVSALSHAMLAPYWQKRLKKSSFCAYHASKRSGFATVMIEDDYVMVGGAVTNVCIGTFEGDFVLKNRA